MKAESASSARARTARRASGRSLPGSTLQVLLAGLLCCLPACGSGDGAAVLVEDPAGENGPGSGSDTKGTIELELELAGVEFVQFQFHIQGNGLDRRGAIGVEASETVSAIIGAIPFGTGYDITLQSQSTGSPPLWCSGSANFDVTTAGVTTVPVKILCRETPTPSAVPVPFAANVALCAALVALGIGLLPRTRKVAP